MNKRIDTRVDHANSKLKLFEPIQIFSFWFTRMSRDIGHVSVISHGDCIGKKRTRSNNEIVGCRSKWLNYPELYHTVWYLTVTLNLL